MHTLQLKKMIEVVRSKNQGIQEEEEAEAKEDLPKEKTTMQAGLLYL
jgi:hypothetical protein